MKPLATFTIAVALLGSPWLPESKAGCGSCDRDKCSACRATSGSCCREEKVTYTEHRTRYKFVKDSVPVCKVKYERRQDPCDPCKKTKVPVTYWENKTRYRFARVCEPVCRTKTVRVCDGAAPAHATIEGQPPTQTDGTGEVGVIHGGAIGPQQRVIQQPTAIQEAPVAPAPPKYENERMAIY